MPSSAVRPSRASSRRRLRRIGAVGAVLVLLLAALAWAGYRYGPRFGFYLVPPSAAQYGQIALEHLEQGYDAAGPEWERARAALEAAARDADDYSDLYEAIADATAVAGGAHSTFLTPDEARQSQDASTESYEAPTVTTSDGITTVVLPELGSVSAELQNDYARSAADAIAEAAAHSCGWIIDLRGNTGGNMYPMLSAVSALLPNGTALSFATRTGDPTPVTVQDDGVGLGSTTVSVGEQTKITRVPIAVLHDGRTASSGEAVATAFRGLELVESFGADTYGYTSANVPITLFDGAVLVLTTSVYVDRDGTSLDGHPLSPDHEIVDEDAGDEAVSWLRERGCTG